MIERNQKRIISVEGGWAAGKTSILKVISGKGYEVRESVVPEIYRVKGENYSPRADAQQFTELFATLKEEQLQKALKQESEMVFFDRVLFAPIVLRRFLGLDVPGAFYEIAKDAGILGPVFLVEPLPLSAHKNGWPRKHFSYEDSLRYQQITEEVVRQLGFDIYKVEYNPDTEQRAQDILVQIETALKGGNQDES